MAEKEKLFFIGTHGEEEPERACFPFMLAMRPRPWTWKRWWPCRATGFFWPKGVKLKRLRFPASPR